jgi:hypothetical protein
MNKIRGLIVNFLSNTIGELLIFIRPLKAKKLAKEGMTVVMDKSGLSVLDRLMRRAILKKVENKGDFDQLAKLHENYWKNKGAGFFDENNNRLELVNLPFSDFIFPLLKEELEKQNGNYHTLVEIGTGNGQILDYLSTKFQGIDKFIGIDLSELQTSENILNYKKNTKLEFVAADAFEWVDKFGAGSTVFLTFMGVLEYFTESRLQDFLKKIDSLGKIIFVAIEPNGHDHDFSENPHSQVYGSERSFSHNYHKLFKNSGFELWHSSKKSLNDSRDYISFIGAKNHI